MQKKILWIDGRRAGGSAFIPALRKKGYQVETVPTGKAAIARLPEVRPHLVVVDASSLRTNGKGICQALQKEGMGVPILFIANPQLPLPKDLEVNVILEWPFTIRKLINRILRFMPGEGNKMLQAGPIQLDLERRQVRVGERETRLTPRMTQLLQEFLKKPGEVLERKRLFRRVWKTEYTGDTRTLDVHISWLRRAIEEDPRKPVYLKTIRGVGYRLDV